MQGSLITKTQVFIKCPKCGDGDSMRVDHLFGREGAFGPWYCDSCGEGLIGKIDKDGIVEISEPQPQTGKKWEKSLVLLVLPTQNAPVYLVVNGHIMDGDKSNHDYLYEEHDCPTNFLRPVERIIVEGDTDPHGLFDYVAEIPCVDLNNLSSEEILLKFGVKTKANET